AAATMLPAKGRETSNQSRAGVMPRRLARASLRGNPTVQQYGRSARPARRSPPENRPARSTSDCEVGWGGRIRTCAWRYQKPLPYRLATPQQRRERAYNGRRCEGKGTVAHGSPIGHGSIGTIVTVDGVAVSAVLWAAECADLRRVIARSVVQRRGVDRDNEAAPLDVVVQQGPGNRVELLPDPEKPSERHDRVERAAAELLDGEVVDMAEFLAGSIVDRGADDPAGENERMMRVFGGALAGRLIHR